MLIFALIVFSVSAQVIPWLNITGQLKGSLCEIKYVLTYTKLNFGGDALIHIVKETLYEDKLYYEPVQGVSFTVDIDTGETNYIYECSTKEVNTTGFIGNKCTTKNDYGW